MKCPNCYAEVPENIMFCPSCGYQFSSGNASGTNNYSQYSGAQQYQYQQPQYQQYQYQQQNSSYSSTIITAVNDSKTAKTLGILSIIFAGLIGLILAIIAFGKCNKVPDVGTSNLNPQEMFNYNQALSNFRTGKTCATIGIILSVFFLIISIVMQIVGFSVWSYLF